MIFRERPLISPQNQQICTASKFSSTAAQISRKSPPAEKLPSRKPSNATGTWGSLSSLASPREFPPSKFSLATLSAVFPTFPFVSPTPPIKLSLQSLAPLSFRTLTLDSSPPSFIHSLSYIYIYSLSLLAAILFRLCSFV
eukprot:Sdes_comp14924_c0_seq1m3617